MTFKRIFLTTQYLLSEAIIPNTTRSKSRIAVLSEALASALTHINSPIIDSLNPIFSVDEAVLGINFLKYTNHNFSVMYYHYFQPLVRTTWVLRSFLLTYK
jgi:hypothetical protein